MVKDAVPTTIRFSKDDNDIIRELQDLTGLDSAAAVIRLALREALAARRSTPKKKKR